MFTLQNSLFSTALDNVVRTKVKVRLFLFHLLMWVRRCAFARSQESTKLREARKCEQEKKIRGKVQRVGKNSTCKTIFIVSRAAPSVSRFRSPQNRWRRDADISRGKKISSSKHLVTLDTRDWWVASENSSRWLDQEKVNKNIRKVKSESRNWDGRVLWQRRLHDMKCAAIKLWQICGVNCRVWWMKLKSRQSERKWVRKCVRSTTKEKKINIVNWWFEWMRIKKSRGLTFCLSCCQNSRRIFLVLRSRSSLVYLFL